MSEERPTRRRKVDNDTILGDKDALGITDAVVTREAASADDQILKNKQLLIAEVIQLESRVAELQTQIVDVQSDLIAAETERDQANIARDQANIEKATADAVRDQANAARATADAARDQANASRDQANAARDQADAARDQANAEKADADTARAQAVLAAGEAERLKAEAVQASETCMSDLAALNTRLDAATTENGRLEKELQDLGDSITQRTTENETLSNIQESLMAQITNTVKLLTAWPTSDPGKTAPLIDKLMLYAPTTLWENDLDTTSLKVLSPIRDILDSIAAELKAVSQLKTIGSGATKLTMLAALDGYEIRLKKFRLIVRRQARLLRVYVSRPYSDSDSPNPEQRRDAVWMFYQWKRKAYAISDASITFLKSKHDMPETDEPKGTKRADGRAAPDDTNDYRRHDSDSSDGSDRDDNDNKDTDTRGGEATAASGPAATAAPLSSGFMPSASETGKKRGEKRGGEATAASSTAEPLPSGFIPSARKTKKRGDTTLAEEAPSSSLGDKKAMVAAILAKGEKSEKEELLSKRLRDVGLLGKSGRLLRKLNDVQSGTLQNIIDEYESVTDNALED